MVNTKKIKSIINFNCNNEEFYDYFVNPKKLSKIMGGKFTNTLKVPGKFTQFDDYVIGENIELTPGKKIVQKWSCQDYPEKHFSKLTIIINKKSEKTCEIDFTLEDVPEELYEDIALMFRDMYFDPIKDYLEDLMWK